MPNLVGTWSCVTHDSTHKTWHETDVYSMWGPWLKDNASFPSQNGERAGTGMSFSTYDAQHGRWVITYADSNGTYFTASSSSHAFNGSHWVDEYPADNGTATVRMTNANTLVIDSTMPDGHGHVSTGHEVCTRV